MCVPEVDSTVGELFFQVDDNILNDSPILKGKDKRELSSSLNTSSNRLISGVDVPFIISFCEFFPKCNL